MHQSQTHSVKICITMQSLSLLHFTIFFSQETATELQPFAVNFKKMIAYMNKLLPYQLSRYVIFF